MDRQRLHADFRRAAADRRRARRPLRPPADVRDRPRHLHARFSHRRAGAQRGRADRRPRRAGRRRRDHHAAHADPALDGLPGRAARARDRRLVGRSPASASRSARWSAAPSSTASPGTGSSGSTSRPGSCSRRWPTAAWPSPTAPPTGWTFPASRSPASACWGSSTPSCAGRSWAGPAPPCSARSRPAPPAVAAFVAWELRAGAPMLPMRFFRTRAFAASNGVSFAMYFGVFGSIFLLAQFFQITQGMSPLEAGLRTLPWTGDADVRRAGRRPAVGPDRLAPADGGRAGAAGHRDRLAGRGDDADGRVLLARAAVRAGRHRHGARVRAGGQCRAERGPPGAGRPGLGRDECDPRDRRHARRRRARLRVRALRLVRVAAGLHRRHDERDLGRRRRARPPARWWPCSSPAGGTGPPAPPRLSSAASRRWRRSRARAPRRRWRRRRPAPGRASAPRRVHRRAARRSGR